MYYLYRQKYNVVWFSKACLFVKLLGVRICHEKIIDLTVLLELKVALNSTTTLSIWKPNTLIGFFRQHLWNIAKLNSTTNQSLAEEVVLSVCSVDSLLAINNPPLETWFFKALRPIFRNVCLCFHVSVCVYVPP